MAYDFGMESNRGNWEFEYLGSDLYEAAHKKAQFRFERLGWWKDQKEKLMNEIKESGLEVQESIASQYATASNNVNPLARGAGAQIVVRNDLQDKLTECQLKIREHDRAMAEYSAWAQVFEVNKHRTYQLKQGDWLFFFGK